ncbi:MAG: hypothetical protein D8M54_10845 [Chloroflexi bacterium]|nr:hypothetical protein [Chloroflexota bacterium]
MAKNGRQFHKGSVFYHLCYTKRNVGYKKRNVVWPAFYPQENLPLHLSHQYHHQTAVTWLASLDLKALQMLSTLLMRLMVKKQNWQILLMVNILGFLILSGYLMGKCWQ